MANPAGSLRRHPRKRMIQYPLTCFSSRGCRDCSSPASAGQQRSESSMALQNLFSLFGQVALVTGSSAGLGVRFAEVLAEAGAAVALVARRADRLAAVQAAIEQAGGRAVAIGAD